MLWTHHGEDRGRIVGGLLRLGFSAPFSPRGLARAYISRVLQISVSFKYIRVHHIGSQISQIRHGVRILRSKGITKSHWHTGQILCQKDNSNIYAVFIGFSFATMLYDYSFDEGVPMTEDLGKVSFILKRLTADQELLDEHWLPPCDFEL